MKLFLIVAAPALAIAGEYAVLSNGFRIEAERHEQIGSMIRLHTNTGSIDMPAAEVVRFELDEIVASPVTQAPIPATVPDKPAPSPRQLVEEAAVRHGLPPAFVHSVAQVESAYRTDAVSPKGAIGVMQLMPTTAAALAADPRIPEQNIEAGARHLRDLLLRYDGNARLELAAYNAGPGAVERYNGVPPYPETQNYVEKVLDRYRRAKQ